MRFRRPAPRAIHPGSGKFLLFSLVVVLGCSDRLTPARAGTIIRHSKAFLSGSPESQPVFDGVTRLSFASAGREKADSCVAEFSYHWRPDGRARRVEENATVLTASVFLRRSGNAWAVDDEQSRKLIASWPQLPRAPNPFWPGVEVRR